MLPAFVSAPSLKLEQSSTATLQDFAKEPFRIFFPLATLVGIIGVALWPLHLLGIYKWYPGQIHARLMAYGLFGGFIFGFLSTAMPRMLSAKPFRLKEVSSLVVIYLTMVGLYLTTNVAAGDLLLIVLLCIFLGCMALRARNRKDTPPPGFVLVALSFLCVIAGAILAILLNYREMDLRWGTLQRVLAYQGFVLLPILGIAPFLLPRFYGLPNPHEFPEMLVPGPTWKRKAALALSVGLIIIVSFVLEALNWVRLAYGLRFAAAFTYAWLEMPMHRAPKARNALGASIRLAFLSLIGGFLAVAILPGYRTGLLHLTLVGGFAVITFVVATRVMFGHSGNIERLKGRNYWLGISVGLMLVAMATRISGDFWPKIMASHYIYGSLLWIGAVLLWACYTLPKVLVVDRE